MRDTSSRLIEGILDDTRDAVREALQIGEAAGQNPRDTARLIVGTFNRATGRREGGLIGLNSAQTDAAIRARWELHNLDAAYFRRQRRDRRYDSLVRRAIRDGKPLSQADIDRVAGRYADRLLALRGETIARTETIGALQAAKMEGIRQLIDSGKVARSAVKKIWRATGDARTRDSHMALNGMEAGIDEAFVSPLTGARMLHPHDTSLGAPASEIIQCRCFWDVRIKYL